jgi:hypothetical protein
MRIDQLRESLRSTTDLSEIESIQLTIAQLTGIESGCIKICKSWSRY